MNYHLQEEGNFDSFRLVEVKISQVKRERGDIDSRSFHLLLSKAFDLRFQLLSQDTYRFHSQNSDVKIVETYLDGSARNKLKVMKIYPINQ